MKKSTAFKNICRSIVLLIAIIPVLIIGSCQKEEEQILNSDVKSEIDSPQRKSASNADYLMDLIHTIENMVRDGLISEGNANALIVKIKNASKSLENRNNNASNGLLSALINQVESFIADGTISEVKGEIIINKAETGIILSRGSFIDERDGNEYSVVLIGDQLWMAENLAYLPSVSPSSVGSPPDIEIPIQYVYGYEGTNVNEAEGTNNYETYGVLYNWESTKTVSPKGWHVASDSEWEKLALYIVNKKGGYTEWSDKWSWYDIGEYLKSTSGWSDLNGTNDYGFSALPSGARNHGGGFGNLGIQGTWWSSTEVGIMAWYRAINNDHNIFYRFGDMTKYVGNSIRCVKD